jgi:transcriptional regulator with XRE-family HTH domain
METDSSLGGRVRRLRKELRLSQAALAASCGVTGSDVSLIETGKRNASGSLLEQIALRLETSVHYLRTGEPVQDIREDRLRLQFGEIALANADADEACRVFAELADRQAREIRLAAQWGLARAQELRGDFRASAAGLEALLPAARDGAPGAPALLELHMARCRVLRFAGDVARSISIGEHALAEVRSLGLEGTEYGIKLAATLVAAYWYHGDLTSAAMLADEVIEHAEQLGDREARGARRTEGTCGDRGAEGARVASTA